MGSLVKSLGVDKMSVGDRWQLVEEILDTLANDSENSDIPQSHKDELDRRLAAAEANPRAGASWKEVKARLQGRA